MAQSNPYTKQVEDLQKQLEKQRNFQGLNFDDARFVSFESGGENVNALRFSSGNQYVRPDDPSGRGRNRISVDFYKAYDAYTANQQRLAQLKAQQAAYKPPTVPTITTEDVRQKRKPPERTPPEGREDEKNLVGFDIPKAQPKIRPVQPGSGSGFLVNLLTGETLQPEYLKGTKEQYDAFRKQYMQGGPRAETADVRIHPMQGFDFQGSSTEFGAFQDYLKGQQQTTPPPDNFNRPRFPGFEEDQPLTERMKKFIAEGKRIDGRKRDDDFLKTLDITIGTDRGGQGNFLNARTPDGIPVLLTSAQKERLAKLKGSDSALGNLLGAKTKLKTDAELFAAATGKVEMAEVSKITTDSELATEVGTLAAGEQGGVPQVEVVRPTVKTDELQKTTGTMLAGTPTATTALSDITGISAAIPTQQTPNLGQIDSITQISPNVTGMTAAQIEDARRPQIDMAQIQGTVSAGSQAVAATEELDPRATVQYQLGELLGSIEEGKPMPAWASPAVRKIAGTMQARGLGSSSMAAAAMTQAVMESGIVIAAQDANKYATIQLQNLNNKQQTALTNAAVIAGMDKANLSARLQASVVNAQTLLATETKNLDARQQSNTLSYNALTQALFKDAAEENARKQFNAKNELQVEEFFAELGSQVETANMNRIAATQQFNAGEVNAQSQFNTAMRDNREKFNANMQYAIDQSNVQWRRQVNTADTALQNETNRINTQNQYNASQNALNNLWQRYRDEAAWSLQKTESFLQRQHEVGIMAMEFANSKELYTQQQKDQLASGIGNWLALWYANR